MTKFVATRQGNFRHPVKVWDARRGTEQPVRISCQPTYITAHLCVEGTEDMNLPVCPRCNPIDTAVAPRLKEFAAAIKSAPKQPQLNLFSDRFGDPIERTSDDDLYDRIDRGWM